MSRRTGPRIERTGPGGGSSPSEEDPAEDPGEDLPEELQNQDNGDTSIGDITQEADAERFDRTFLAEKESFQIGGELNSPAPFPLQTLPRLAYVINYNVVYDEDRERWVPQKKGNTGAVELVATGTESLAVNDQVTRELGLPSVDLDGDGLFPAASVTSEPANAAEFTWSDANQSNSTEVTLSVFRAPAKNDYTLEITNNEDTAVEVAWSVGRLRT